MLGLTFIQNGCRFCEERANEGLRHQMRGEGTGNMFFKRYIWIFWCKIG